VELPKPFMAKVGKLDLTLHDFQYVRLYRTRQAACSMDHFSGARRSSISAVGALRSNQDRRNARRFFSKCPPFFLMIRDEDDAVD
jgi:hypothetical protein